MKALIFFALLLVSASPALGAVIDIEVAEQLKGTFTFVNYTQNNGVVNMSAEFYNSGSIAYRGKVRWEIRHGKSFTSIWSNERTLLPGDRELFNMFWHPGKKKNVTMKVKAYFGNEIFDSDAAGMEAGSDTADVFTIDSIRMAANRAEFQLGSNADSRPVAVLLDLPPGWVSGPVHLGNVVNGSSMKVVIPYASDVWPSHTIRIAVFSEDGRHYSERSVRLRMEPDKSLGVANTIAAMLRKPLVWLLRAGLHG